MVSGIPKEDGGGGIPLGARDGMKGCRSDGAVELSCLRFPGHLQRDQTLGAHGPPPKDASFLATHFLALLGHAPAWHLQHDPKYCTRVVCITAALCQPRTMYARVNFRVAVLDTTLDMLRVYLQ